MTPQVAEIQFRVIIGHKVIAILPSIWQLTLGYFATMPDRIATTFGGIAVIGTIAMPPCPLPTTKIFHLTVAPDSTRLNRTSMKLQSTTWL